MPSQDGPVFVHGKGSHVSAPFCFKKKRLFCVTVEPPGRQNAEGTSLHLTCDAL